MNRLPTFPRDAYSPKAARIRGVKRRPPSQRGWDSGWPDCQRDRIVKVVATGRSLRVRREIADLVGLLVAGTVRLGYPILPKEDRDGGVGSFACRAIKRSDPPAPSWHSWGLAVDLNSRANPMFRDATGWRSTQPPWMIDLWESAGFFWGGRYTAYADCMHFEYLFRPDDVATDQANARAAFERISAQLGSPVTTSDEGGEPMPSLSVYLPGFRAQVIDPRGPVHVRNGPSPRARIRRTIPRGQSEAWTIVGWAKGRHSPFGDSDQWLVRWHEGQWEYTAKGNVPSEPVPPGAG